MTTTSQPGVPWRATLTPLSCSRSCATRSASSAVHGTRIDVRLGATSPAATFGGDPPRMAAGTAATWSLRALGKLCPSRTTTTGLLGCVDGGARGHPHAPAEIAPAYPNILPPCAVMNPTHIATTSTPTSTNHLYAGPGLPNPL